jgi:hypothetical protein
MYKCRLSMFLKNPSCTGTLSNPVAWKVQGKSGNEGEKCLVRMEREMSMMFGQVGARTDIKEKMEASHHSCSPLSHVTLAPLSRAMPPRRATSTLMSQRCPAAVTLHPLLELGSTQALAALFLPTHIPLVTGAFSRRAVRALACRQRNGMEPLLSCMLDILSRRVLHTHCSLSILPFSTASLRFGLRASLRPLALARFTPFHPH